MEHRLGIIAGSGEFPVFVLTEAQKRGYSCVIAGIRGQAASSLQERDEKFEWFEAHDIINLISFFKKHDVREILFAGKIDHKLIYKKELNTLPHELLDKSQEKTPTAIIKSVIDFLTHQGFKVKEPDEFLSLAFCEEGILTENQPSLRVEKDIVFGWKIAQDLADSDIGQTVVVKDCAVVALEGMEGTDEAIRRGGRLVGEGIVCIKVCRSRQDSRIDLPAVGLSTVENLVDVGGKAFCFEARSIPFFQKKEAIALANANNLVIVARKR